MNKIIKWIKYIEPHIKSLLIGYIKYLVEKHDDSIEVGIVNQIEYM